MIKVIWWKSPERVFKISRSHSTISFLFWVMKKLGQNNMVLGTCSTLVLNGLHLRLYSNTPARTPWIHPQCDDTSRCSNPSQFFGFNVTKSDFPAPKKEQMCSAQVLSLWNQKSKHEKLGKFISIILINLNLENPDSQISTPNLISLKMVISKTSPSVKGEKRQATLHLLRLNIIP